VNQPRPPRRGTATDESIRRRPSVEIPRRIAFYKQSEGITEVRPCCPRCASPRVRRHGREYGFIGKGWWTRRLTESCWKSRWECADCHRYFVTEDRGFLDHRFLREPISDQALRILAGGEEQRTVASAEAEAQSLFDYCERFGPMASTQFGKVRGEIMASKQDREALELMIKGGLLDRAEVHRALAFREKVLREFQRLVEEA
jgi:transposase-like protein